jgi:hypothetical protein
MRIVDTYHGARDPDFEDVITGEICDALQGQARQVPPSCGGADERGRYAVNRKRVQRLMRLVAIYQRPNTSKAATEHAKYPYLLGGLTIDRVNQVWCSDITLYQVRVPGSSRNMESGSPDIT